MLGSAAPSLVPSAGLDMDDDDDLRSRFASLRDSLHGCCVNQTGTSRAQPATAPLKTARDIEPAALRDRFGRPAGPASRNADDAQHMRRVMTAAAAAAQAARLRPAVPRTASFVVPTLGVSAAGRAPNLESVRQAELLIVAATGPAARHPPALPKARARQTMQAASIAASAGAARQAELMHTVRLHAAAVAHRTLLAL